MSETQTQPAPTHALLTLADFEAVHLLLDRVPRDPGNAIVAVLSRRMLVTPTQAATDAAAAAPATGGKAVQPADGKAATKPPG